MNLEEKWVPVKGFEEWYDTSNFGRLKSHKKRGTREEEGKVLSLKNKQRDYFRMNLTDPRTKLQKTVYIHRLVYEHFVGTIPSGYHVHHIDGNKQNDRIDNLVLLTPAQHVIETHKANPNLYNGMIRYNQYEKTKEIYMYDLYGNYLASFPNASCAERVTGVCKRNILQVANKTEFSKGHVRHQAGNYIWSFEKTK